MADHLPSAHPLLTKTDWNSEDLPQILQKKWHRNLTKLTAAEFLVLKDFTSSSAELEEIIRKLIPKCKLSKLSNVTRASYNFVSKENYDHTVIEKEIEDLGFIGPSCSERGISFNDLVIKSRKLNASEITVEIFLEICTHKKNDKTWQDVSVWLENLANVTLTAHELRKKFESLSSKKKVLCKNKKGDELDKLRKSSICQMFVKKQNALTLSGTEVHNFDKKLKHMSSENISLNTTNMVLKEIVTEQTVQISKLQNTTRYKITENQNLKKKCKKLKELKLKNEQRNIERNELKVALKGVKKENFYKRLKRKENKYIEMENEVKVLVENEKRLTDKIEKLQKSQRSKEMGKIKKKSSNEINYLKRKCEELKDECSKATVQTKELTKRNNELEQTVENIECGISEQVKQLSIHDGHKYTDDLRKCVMQLQSLDLPCNKIGKVIDTVSESIFHTDLNKIPSRSTVQNIVDEGHFLARKQVASEVLQCDNWDLFADGTSRDGMKILDAGIHLSDKRTLSLGFKTVAKEDSDTVSKTVKTFLSDTAVAYNPDAVSHDEITAKMLSTLSSLMSDRSSVMKKYNELFDEWRKKLLEDKISEENINKLNFIYCSAHVLLGFHTAVENTLKTESGTESSDESLSVRTIRIVCELFGPRGDEKNGRRQDWLAYMKVVGKDSKIPSYRANRFNNLFEGAVAISYHADDIQTFISEYVENPNAKLRTALSNLQKHIVIVQILAIGILSSILTEPFWRIINNPDVSYFDLWKYFRPLQSSLNHWSTDAADLFDKDLEPLFPEFPHKKHDHLQNLSDDIKSPCKDILQKMFHNILIVFKRQLADHLAGGYIASLTDAELSRAKHSKTTNLSAEHFFGDLDYSIRRKRNASVRHHSGIIMLKRNKTVQWVSKHDDETQGKLLKDARKYGRSLRTTEQTNEVEVKNIRKEHIIALKEKKEQKERKLMIEKEKLTREIELMGGVCKNAKDVKKLLKAEHTTLKKLQVLKKQLMYHKKVLNTNVSNSKVYCLSANGKSLSQVSLQNNLMVVINSSSES